MRVGIEWWLFSYTHFDQALFAWLENALLLAAVKTAVEESGGIVRGSLAAVKFPFDRTEDNGRVVKQRFDLLSSDGETQLLSVTLTSSGDSRRHGDEVTSVSSRKQTTEYFHQTKIQLSPTKVLYTHH